MFLRISFLTPWYLQDPALFTEEELITARLIRDQYTGGNFSVETNMPALLKL